MVVKIKVALLSPACNYDIVQYTVRCSENCAASTAGYVTQANLSTDDMQLLEVLT